MEEINKFNKSISEQTKEVLENFFCFNGVDSRKKFEKLIINKEKYEKRYWSDNETIVNYLLSHPQFKFTKTKCKELTKISNDWSSPNKNGENSTFFLLRTGMKINEINELIKDLKIDIYQKNVSHLYFSNYFLNIDNFNKIINDSLTGKNNFPEIRVVKELKQYQEILLSYPELFKETNRYELEKIQQIKKALSNEDFRNKNQKNAINANMDDEIKKVEQMLFYFSLENNLSSKTKDKKNKI